MGQNPKMVAEPVVELDDSKLAKRVRELMQEHGFIDTDMLKHALEDWSRWKEEGQALPKSDHSLLFEEQQLGGHVHVRVFGREFGTPNGKCGDLTFREREWPAVRKLLRRAGVVRSVSVRVG